MSKRSPSLPDFRIPHVDEDDIRVQRVLNAAGEETAVLICAECGEEWEPPPGEDGLVCPECAYGFMESEYDPRDEEIDPVPGVLW